MQNQVTALQFFAAWTLFLLLLFFLAKTKWGQTLLYYLCWALCLLLIVSHYQDIQTLFSGVVTPSS